MTGPLDPLPPSTDDRAESEAEAYNRDSLKAARQNASADGNAGHGEPGGQPTPVAGGAGPTGLPQADAGDDQPEADVERPDPGSRGALERGMLGEGV